MGLFTTVTAASPPPRIMRLSADGLPALVQEIRYSHYSGEVSVRFFNDTRMTFSLLQAIPAAALNPLRATLDSHELWEIERYATAAWQRRVGARPSLIG